MATAELSLQIQGMTCGSCVSHVDKALRSVPGVTDAAVNLAAGTATVRGSADQSKLVTAVERAGYKARVVENLSARTLRDIHAETQADENRVRNRLLIGVLLGIPAMALEMMVHHQSFVMNYFHAGVHEGHILLAAALTTGVIFTTGLPFFTRGIRAALHKNPTMDTLVALGAGTAYVASAVSLILFLGHRQVGTKLGFPQPEISQFHAAVAIILLITLGKYLEARAKHKASSAVADLAAKSSPTATRILADGSLQTIPAEQINVGDSLQILAHQQLPVDGTLIGGAGSLDLSIITGESLPIELNAETPPPAPAPAAKKSLSLALHPTQSSALSHQHSDAAVLPGGATLTDGRITLRATSTAGESTVARILHLVSTAQASKTQIQATADKVAAVFVPLVLAAGILNFAGHLLIAYARHGQFASIDWTHALLTTIATIIIACPCAMGLATPTAITVAMGRAARLGILYTQAAALEAGHGIAAILFDKTGTLTTGKPHLVETLGIVYADTPAGPAAAELTPAGQKALQLAASLEQYADHPLAKPLLDAAGRFGLSLTAPEKFTSVPGGGISAAVDHRHYALGSIHFIESLGTDLSPIHADIERLRNDGKTIALLAEKGSPPRLLGLFAFQDTLRPDARETVHVLRERGIKVGVISGDTELAVRGAIQNMAVDFLHSGVRPQEKAALVAQFKAEAQKQASGNRKRKTAVAFVGDGINDAPALAAADLGIAMATGANLAKAAGDVLLMSNHLAPISAVLELSERTLRIIKQNLFWAFAYNVAAIPLAMLGILPPVAAAGAMILSSLSVVANALRLQRVKLS